MASGAKRLKLSRRKNYPQLEIYQSNESSTHNEASTSSSRVNEDQNQCTTTAEPAASSSLQTLRKKLKSCLPELPDWREFSGFPDSVEELPSDTKDFAFEGERLKEKCIVERSVHFASTSSKRTENPSIAGSSKTSSSVAQMKPPEEKIPTKNPFIEQCPLCSLSFPHDWDQNQIQLHVSTHLDADDFD